jgi:hypothetical protein
MSNIVNKCNAKKIKDCIAVGKFCNPLSGRCVIKKTLDSAKKKSVVTAVIHNVKPIIVNKCNDKKIKECIAVGKFCNPSSGRCVAKNPSDVVKTKPEVKKVVKQLVSLVSTVHLKKLTIYEFKNEWKAMYDITTFKLIFNIIESPDNFLNMKLSKTEKIIGLTGDGSLLLRKIKDIALANKENTDIYLPKNYTGKYYANPMWNKVHGYMYYINETNIKNLSRIVETINLINKKYKKTHYRLSESFIDNNKTHGIIGVDIKYTESKWITDLVKGNPLQNPILNEKRQIIFSKCAISMKTIENANIYLQKKMPKEFALLYSKYIYIASTKDPLDKLIQLNNFIKSDCKIANIAYDKHARIIFKNNDKLYIIDPWKQIADTGTRNLIKTVPNLGFITRKSEQTTEGSCTAVSYARALHMTLNGVDKINDSIPLDFIVLSSRLISKFRNKK